MARLHADLHKAIELQILADTAALSGNHAKAALLFDVAAELAQTPEGSACLRAKAAEARAATQREAQ